MFAENTKRDVKFQLVSSFVLSKYKILDINSENSDRFSVFLKLASLKSYFKMKLILQSLLSLTIFACCLAQGEYEKNVIFYGFKNS